MNNKQRTRDIILDNEHWPLYPLLGVQRTNHANGQITKGVIIAGETSVYEIDIDQMDHQEPDHGSSVGCKLSQQLQGVAKHRYLSTADIVEEGWEVSPLSGG